jgi:glycosyltransferase involved in cell wall biosynthesis
MTGPAVREFVFVLEQMLGHTVHGANLASTVALDPGVHATVIPIAPNPHSWTHHLPAASSWSFQASSAARAALHRRLRHGHPDALFIHTQVAALLSVRTMRSVPTIVSLDATPLNYDSVGEGYGHRRSAAPLEWAKWRVNRRAFAAASGLVCWCRWAAESLVRDYGVPVERVHVIRPGVDLRRFRPVARGGRTGPVRILFVGGDFERKGGGDLLEAALALGPSVELDIVSPTAPPPDRLPAGVRVHTEVGHDGGTLDDLHRRADIFALPSRSDCLPLAVAEALGSGLPVVTTDVGALPEMVRQGWNGFVVPPRRPDRMVAALRPLVDDPEMRLTMGARGRVIACEEHDAERNNRAIIELMGQVADARETACGSRGMTQRVGMPSRSIQE